MAPTTSDNTRWVRDKVSDLFQVPRPVKALFDAVPVLTYPANERPERSPEPSELPCLYIFSTEQDARAGKPSYNPGCLKWQTAVRMSALPHTVAPSTNHASPTGTLPFLLPPTRSPMLPAALLPIPSTKILSYASKQAHKVSILPTTKFDSPSPVASKAEAYMNMIDTAIRPAWLHSLYLSPRNAHIVKKLYIKPTTSSWLVQRSVEHSLTTAAHEQLVSSSRNGVPDIDDIYARAAQAFEAFYLILEGAAEAEEWLFGGDEKGRPTLLDAALFAYTHLLLDESMGWKDQRLVRFVQKCEVLRRHRERMLREFYA